jgi:hypothetical protein
MLRGRRWLHASRFLPNYIGDCDEPRRWQGVTVMDSHQARARAEASFKKEERAREGAKAMMEYEAEARATQEKTARLRALRLAKEAADKVSSPLKSRANKSAR